MVRKPGSLSAIQQQHHLPSFASISPSLPPSLSFIRYAPFCKHVFVPNFAGVKTSTVEVAPDNEKLLVTGYEARTDKVLQMMRATQHVFARNLFA